MLRFRVFDETGSTLLGEIASPVDGQFLDEMNATGVGRVTVIADSPDDDLLQRDRVVKVYYEDVPRFAFSVETVRRDLIDASNVVVTEYSGRGILAWLEDAIVFPQAGLSELASTERPFSFASADGAWESSASFTTPQGVLWRSDTTDRAGSPQGWPDIEAQWIWSTSPTTANVPRGTVNWFRSEFTTTAMQQARIWATADSQFELWLDGTLILSSNRFSTDYQAWQQFTAVTVRIPAGDHTFAAFVRNGQPWSRSDATAIATTNVIGVLEHGLTDGTAVKVIDRSTDNGLTIGTTYYVRDATTDTFRLATSPGGSAVDITADSTVDVETVELGTAGFLMSSATLDAVGNPSATIVRTNTTDWEVSQVEPLWRPAEILRTLVSEAQARGVYRVSSLDISGFSASADSASAAWTTETSTNIRVGATLLDVHNELIEQDVDFRVDPDTFALQAYDALGADKSNTVYLTAGSNLTELGTSVDRRLKTVAVIRTSSGWATTAVPGQRREAYLEAGGATSANQARSLAAKLLERTGVTLESANAVTIMERPGAVPYVDFTVGDIVSIPNDSGGYDRARVLSLSATHDGTRANWSAELSILTGNTSLRRSPRLWEQQVSSRLRAISPGLDLGATVTQPVPPEDNSRPGDPGGGGSGEVISLNQPSTPALSSSPLGLVVGWDGKDAGGVNYPTQGYVIIHVGTTPGFTPSAATTKGVLYAQGIFTIQSLTGGQTYYVKLIGATNRGVRSVASAEASLVVPTVVDEIDPGSIDSGLVSFDARALGGIAQFVGPTTPTGGTYVQGDTWINTTNLSYYVWNGSSWVQQQWGQSAISAGAIDTAQLAAGAITADKIDGNTLTGVTIQTKDNGFRIRLQNKGAGIPDGIEFLQNGTVVGLIDVDSFGMAIAASNIDFFTMGGLPPDVGNIGGLECLTLDVVTSVLMGLSGGSPAFRVNASGQVFSRGIENSTSGNPANVRLLGASQAQLVLSTSTVRNKTDLKPLVNTLEGVAPDKISDEAASCDWNDVLTLAPVVFRSLCDVDNDDEILGFVAEDVAAKFPWAAEWDEEGQPSTVNDRPILAALLAVVRDQAGIIEELTTRIETLEAT